MTSESLKIFFADRPALSVRQIAKEAGMGYRTLQYKLDDNPREVSEEQARQLKPVLEKYGWNG